MLGAGVGDGNDLTDGSGSRFAVVWTLARAVQRGEVSGKGGEGLADNENRDYLYRQLQKQKCIPSSLPCTQYVRPLPRPSLPRPPPHAPHRPHPLLPLLSQRGQAPQTHHHRPAPDPRGRLHHRHKTKREPPQRARRTARHDRPRRPGMSPRPLEFSFPNLIFSSHPL